MTKPTHRLGRGLNALMTARDTAQPGAAADKHPHTPDVGPIIPLLEIPLTDIVPNPRQPRTNFDEQATQQLADSIRTNGVIQPVVVRRRHDGHFELVAGERRLRAAKVAQIDRIPAVVRELSDSEAMELALVENLQREDLGPLERASAYRHYLEIFGGTIDELARKLSLSRANVSNYLRLLGLHPEVCFLLGSGELGMGQARAIAGLEDGHRQVALAKLAVRRNLSVRQVEDLVRQSLGQDKVHDNHAPGAPSPARRHAENVGESLSRAVGLRIRLIPGRKKNSGRVVIHYNSLEEFDIISSRLAGKAGVD